MLLVRICLAILLFLGAATAAVVPLTGRQLPRFPERPPGAFERKYRLEDTIHGTLKGTPSLKGLRKLNSLSAELHFSPDQPPLSVPVKTKATSDDWTDTIKVETNYTTSPYGILYDVGPFPDDPRLPGSSPTLTVIANVTYPAKVDDEHFEPRTDSPREITGVTFFAPGEFEKRAAALHHEEAERARILQEFKREMSQRRLVWWSVAGICAAVAIGLLVVPRKTAN